MIVWIVAMTLALCAAFPRPLLTPTLTMGAFAAYLAARQRSRPQPAQPQTRATTARSPAEVMAACPDGWTAQTGDKCTFKDDKGIDHVLDLGAIRTADGDHRRCKMAMNAAKTLNFEWPAVESVCADAE